MNWQEKLRTYFEKEDYDQCINLLREELRKPFCNDEDLSLNLMYVYMYMYMLKTSSNTESQMALWEKNILAIHKNIIENYRNSAKTLFYTANIFSIAEWILDLSTDDINRMYYQAWLLAPNDKVYKYGYLQFFLDESIKADLLFEEIRNDDCCLQKLKMMSILGDDFIDTMNFFYKRS